MKQYNIYAGLSGSFGGANYQYTSLCETGEEAEEEAFQIACENYEQYEGLHSLYSWEDAIKDYCNDQEIDPEDLTYEDTQEIEDYYDGGRESWLDYYAVPTDEDNIDPEDLIIGYTTEDDSTSQADSK